MIAPNKTHHRTIDLKLWWKLVLLSFYRWQNWESVNLKNTSQVPQRTQIPQGSQIPQRTSDGTRPRTPCVSPSPVCFLQSSAGHPAASWWSVVLSLHFCLSLTHTRDPFLPPGAASPHTFHTRPRLPPFCSCLWAFSPSPNSERSLQTQWAVPVLLKGVLPVERGRKQQQTPSYYRWVKLRTSKSYDNCFRP